eukprot:TRINITY_DN738_c0_g1_i1.p1 TRINITY_DN738_c0_g1~~TRINITY_DN738_c0_g1_i1.p1  ORF type:complete len:619 (+),score=169.02 TRINITY_DN738_c0_g1_i1:51-1907(+)
MDDEIEKILPNYKFLKVIGTGSFGKCSLVQDLEGDEWVLKTIKLNELNETEIEDAHREASHLNRLTHPFIVEYHESFVFKNYLCIIMEYCEQGDLSTYLKKRNKKPLSENQILDWFSQLTTALAHCHKHKVLHRDLKAQNIFISQHNHLKLGDFGIAKVLCSTRDMTRSIVGTPYYMSPELVNGEPYGFKSDVWALGCILYELCSRRHVFNAQTMSALIVKILSGKINFDLPYSNELLTLLKRMLEKNINKRPSVYEVLRTPLIFNRMRHVIDDGKKAGKISFDLENNNNKIDSSKQRMMQINNRRIQQIRRNASKVDQKIADAAERRKKMQQQQNKRRVDSYMDSRRKQNEAEKRRNRKDDLASNTSSPVDEKYNEDDFSNVFEQTPPLIVNKLDMYGVSPNISDGMLVVNQGDLTLEQLHMDDMNDGHVDISRETNEKLLAQKYAIENVVSRFKEPPNLQELNLRFQELLQLPSDVFEYDNDANNLLRESMIQIESIELNNKVLAEEELYTAFEEQLDSIDMDIQHEEANKSNPIVVHSAESSLLKRLERLRNYIEENVGEVMFEQIYVHLRDIIQEFEENSYLLVRECFKKYELKDSSLEPLFCELLQLEDALYG